MRDDYQGNLPGRTDGHAHRGHRAHGGDRRAVHVLRAALQDNRLAASVSSTLAKSLPITSQQVSLLLQMFSLQSAKRPVPAAIRDGLRTGLLGTHGFSRPVSGS